LKHNTFARPNISRVKEEEDTQQRQIIGRVAGKKKEKKKNTYSPLATQL
jgi:hypothetical protein